MFPICRKSKINLNSLADKKNTDLPLEDARRYRHILDTMEESYFECDLNGNVFFFNDRVLLDLGYEREEFQDLNFRKLMDGANVEKVYRVFHNVFVSGEPIKGFDWEILKKNGEKIDVESSVSLIRDENGAPVGFRGVVRDVTKRIKAELKLRESEERYRKILEDIEEMYIEIDLKGNYVFFNDAVCRAYGYSREELRNVNFRRFHPSREVQERILHAFNEIYRTGRSRPFLVDHVQRRNGTSLFMETTVSLRRSPTGKPIGFAMVARDVTEKMEADRKLREGERRLRLIADNVDDIIWTMNFDLWWTYVSPSAFRMTGYTPEEIVKTPLRKLIPAEMHESIKRKLAKQLVEDRGDTEPITFEYEMIHKNGHLFWTEISVSFNRDESGKPFEIVGVTREISKRKQAEEALRESEKRYRMIVENMHDSILLLDTDLNYRYISPSEAGISGFEPEELLNRPLRDQMPQGSYEIIKKAIADELARELSGEPAGPVCTRTVEIEVFHKNGGTVWKELTCTCTRDANGKATGILAVSRNITERKKAEEERTKLERQLIQAQKMETVGRLAGGVAHDFNNMLSVILGYGELSKLHLDDGDPVLRNIEEIEKAALRSRDIINQLLAFSRKQIIAPKILDLNELIFKTEKALIRLIGEDVQFSFHPGKHLWPLKADSSQIEQILFNLAVNGRDAMPGGGKLEIETQNASLDHFYCKDMVGLKPGNYVLLTVNDDGTGMDKETLQYIFEPFFTTKEVGQGTGLGLATVYGIVKQNNGYISASSEPGQGTSFKIFLPRAEEQTDAGRDSAPAAFESGSGNILLVEDDPMVLQIAKEMLESIGYRVEIADAPLKAVSLCSKDPSIDLVVTDVIMPAMTGKELRDRLAELRPGIRVLYMSGHTANTIELHGVLEEGAHFLQKPFTINDLAAKVKEVMNS